MSFSGQNLINLKREMKLNIPDLEIKHFKICLNDRKIFIKIK